MLRQKKVLWLGLPLIAAALLVWAFVASPLTAQASSLGQAPDGHATINGVGPADLFFSEYIEGSSNNKAIEIYNGTGSTISFTGQYTVALYANGASAPTNKLTLSGSIAAGDVYVIANAGANAAILAQADTTSTVTYFNGDDALALYKNGVLIDVIGQIGTDPGSYWGTTPNTTADHTLVRKSSILAGDTNGGDAFDPVTEWDTYASDTTSYLGAHSVVCVTDLFFSEYIEGTSNNKAIEIYNGTGSTISFTGQYTVALYANGASAPTNKLTLSGSIANKDVYVIANAGANAAILAQADTTSTVTYFNGDDALALYKNGVLIDVIGQIGTDPGSYWGTTPNTTADHTLVRNGNIISGDANGGDAFDPVTEWTTYAADTTSYLGSHTVSVCGLGGVSDLIVKKFAPAFIWPNQQVVYQIRLENTATTTATNVIVTDTLPISITYLSSTFPVTPTNPTPPSVWMWNLGNFGPSKVVTYTLTAQAGAVVPGQVLTNTVKISTSLPGDSAATNLSKAASTVKAPTMHISKTAPGYVSLNGIYTYTLSVKNELGMTATGVVITDSLPVSVTYQSSSDGGVILSGNVVSWTISSLENGAYISRRVAVQAPAAAGVMTNSDYGVWASNWLTRTVGAPVITTIYDPNVITPIAVARAAGVGWTGTLRGNVTVPPGVYRGNAFVIQDATGGLYIYTGSKTLPPIALGDVIQVKGTLKLYSGLLEMDPTTSITWIDSGAVPAPQVIATNAVSTTQGLLVQVSGTASWSTPPPAPGASDWSFYINDGYGSTQIFVDKDTAIDMTGFTSPMPMSVIGFSSKYNTTFQVMPRFQSDIIDMRPPAVTATDPANAETNVSLYYPLSATFNKALTASTVNSTTFTLSDGVNPASGVVSYNSGAHTAIFTPSPALAPFTVYTATLTTGIQDSYGVHLATPYKWSFTTGAADTTPPAIVGRLPLPGATSVPLNANVVVTFTEDLHPSSLDQAHFILTGPYGVVPAALSYNPSTYVVTLDPSAILLPTTDYTVTVKGTTSDWAGLTLGADDTWSFETSVEPPMSVYFGDLHNHTSYSDGAGSPTQALAAGKAAGFSFMAITDHSYAVDDAEWQNTLTAVNSATMTDFVALRGFEYTQGAEGHINVYNSVRHATRTKVAGCTFCDYTPNLEAGVTVQGFYPWLAISGTIGIDAAGTVMQFNHPGWINFNDWTFHPEVSSVARLEEVGNGSGTSYAFSEDEFQRSLDYGWKVGATNNADTHSAYWGLNTDHRTGVLMPELTKTALLEALQARRTFASEDKNFALQMKANGAWMGSEIANSGQIAFWIDGSDLDGELATLVQLITDQGEVAAEIMPNQAAFTWEPQFSITTGVHYYYVKVTQADGDRIVSSPVWTMGDEDIAITDIVIQPTIPTIYSPSLLTARVTNRVASSRTVTVTMEVNGVPLTPSVVVVVPANGDAYANFSWQPTATGAVTVTANLVGAPAGDNPDDNSASLELTVTDEQLPLILIDAGHGNVNAAGREMRMFIDDLSAHRYNVLKNIDALTAADLNPAVVKLLLITAPQYAYTEAELDAIGDYVDAGGSLWLCGLADYTGKVPWADTVADRLNAIVDRIEVKTASTINMRMNDDEVIDGNTNNGYPFGVLWGGFPGTATTSIGLNVVQLASWSMNSIRGRTVSDPLIASTPGVQIVVWGDLDEGYTSDTWHNPFHTSNTDADEAGDAYIYNPSWFYPNPAPANPDRVPLAAVSQLPDGAGRIMLYGDSNDPFTTFAYTAGDGKQNELFNLEAVMWLLGEPLQKSTIAEARAQAVVNEPDKLDQLVWVEGEITAAYGEFFNVLYVQDETGGITVHAPAGDIDPASFTRGTKVRVVGTVGIYNGDTEIEFFEAEMVQVITPSAGEPEALPFTTYQASLEDNQGWLGVITGTVMSKTGTDTLIVDDGSGPVRVFLDGYNGEFSDIAVNDLVRATGLLSEDGDGGRIRVRNYKMHTGYADDVVKLGVAPTVQFSAATYSVSEAAGSATITVTLSASPAIPVTINYAAVAGTATASDFTPTSGALTFAPGETQKTFTVTVLNDTVDELDETVALSLSTPANALLGTPDAATLTIQDDDGQPTVYFGSATYSVNEGAGTASIDVALSNGAVYTVTVNYAAAAGSATSSDFTPTSDMLIFAPGETQKTFTVTILEDALDEANETVALSLSDPISAALGTPAASTLTIQDNDAAPTVSFSAANYNAAESAGVVTVTVNLSAVSGQSVNVNYAAAAGTATSSDFTPASGLLTFAPGETQKTFKVTILEDAMDEPNETVALSLATPVNATLGAQSTGTVTILDNDAAPTVQLSAATYHISEAGGVVVITLTLSAPSAFAVTVNYATSDGTATSGVDYTPANGTLTFAPGETSKTITVPLTNDTTSDPNETLMLLLTAPVNATLGATQTTTVYIMDDDSGIYLPRISKLVP